MVANLCGTRHLLGEMANAQLLNNNDDAIEFRRKKATVGVTTNNVLLHEGCVSLSNRTSIIW